MNYYILLISILYCRCLLLFFTWRLQQGHLVPSHWINKAHVLQYFCPSAYLDFPNDLVALYCWQIFEHPMLVKNTILISILKVHVSLDQGKTLSRSDSGDQNIILHRIKRSKTQVIWFDNTVNAIWFISNSKCLTVAKS